MKKNIIIQICCVLFFTIYFIAHHFLGVFNTRWIFYIASLMFIIYALKNKKKNDKKFSEGFCFNKVFLLYVIGCMIGVYWEEVRWFVLNHEWVSRQGIIYGPFNPIYGAGFFLFTILLCRNTNRKWWITYIYSCLIGGATEWVLSWISETVFKVNAWDYTGKFLNIFGRTTVPFMLFWGLGGLIFVKFVYPILSRMIESIPKRIGDKIMPSFMIFVLISHIFSYAALYRQGQRAENKEPISFVGEILDKYYPDELMKEYYENSNHQAIGDNHNN